MKKGYRKFLIAMLIIPLVVIIIATYWSVTRMNPEPQPTENEYTILKEYCIQFAFGEISEEELEEKGIEIKKISTSINGESLRIEMGNNRCQVAAVFLISNARTLIENGTVCQKSDIEFDNIIYLEKSLISSKLDVVSMYAMIYLVWVVITFVICVAIPNEYKKCKKKEAEEKKEKENT